MSPPKESSAAVLRVVTRSETPQPRARISIKSLDRQQRLHAAEACMEELESDLEDTVEGLKTGAVDFSDIDPD
jgi:Tfp pilus assembly protein PilX